MQIHLDPLGGLAGDMFAAAVLDAFPNLWPAVQESIAALGLGPQAQARLEPFRDATLGGRRFVVPTPDAPGTPLPRHTHDKGTHHHSGHDHSHAPSGAAHHAEPHAHEHRSWASIRGMIDASGLAEGVKLEAIAIFALLAEAEAQVHGIAVDDVAFHEVGALDSIVDIVTAARLIVELAAQAWTCAPLPLGSGRVRTAHGWLPVPAPATTLLIRGLPTIDDGIAGERVTPTGAAILRRVLATGSKPDGQRRPRVLDRTGFGFGTKTLPGVSNCLRLLAFTDGPEPGERLAGTGFTHRELAVIAFEVDDQSPEDLAAGLDRLRDLAGVHDVVQSATFGKKNRMATHVQVLAAPAVLERAIAACFDETTTIGLRYHMVQGAVLARTMDEVEVDGRMVRVKSVVRPSRQRTAKAEVADAATAGDGPARLRLRRTAEEQALALRAAASASHGPDGTASAETPHER